MGEEITTANDVFDMFYSSFQDNFELPDTLLLQWLNKAIIRYNLETGNDIKFDKDLMEFDSQLDGKTVVLLGMLIKQYYQEREVSRVNKIVSMKGSSMSIDGQGTTKKYAQEELNFTIEQVNGMFAKIKPTAYC